MRPVKTSHIWWAAVLLALGGLVLQLWGADVEATDPAQDSWGVLGMLLVVVPLGLAVNITARRRRDASGASSPDSVEFRVAQEASSRAYADTVVLGAALVLVLAVVAGTLAALAAMAFLAVAVGAFWIRYWLGLRAMRG